jgi:hypothetical protein
MSKWRCSADVGETGWCNWRGLLIITMLCGAAFRVSHRLNPPADAQPVIARIFFIASSSLHL